MHRQGAHSEALHSLAHAINVDEQDECTGLVEGSVASNATQVRGNGNGWRGSRVKPGQAGRMQWQRIVVRNQPR